ncbi:MAG: hypothetical protein K6E50_15730 [Lachnospiraceae bacterium]|nr:hypothetical protein [Lachnospiraceae bacterium]
MRTANNETGLKVVRIAALAVLALNFGILAFGWISGTELPDAAIRFLGVIDLIAIPAGVFAGVRLSMNLKNRR